ncbi:MAG: hypothetical protein HPY61_03790 [Methanotrichaceae archaeon]|nr:hypothetical protein [Methanotrichaceae archaeon]
MFSRNYGYRIAASRGGSTNTNRAQGESTEVTCSECGKKTQVPFKPDGSRPVYCNECYRKHRPARAPRRS